MNNIINRDTFKAESVETASWGAVFDIGTVEVTLGNETKTLPARRAHESNAIYITSGIGGRYRTSTKIWKASVSQLSDGRDRIWFGRDDRNMNFNKNSIFFTDKV
jgi:hypothetical protein